MKKYSLITLSAFAFFILSQINLFAQAGPPGPGGEGAPIDGGALALLISTGIYGYHRLRKSKVVAEN